MYQNNTENRLPSGSYDGGLENALFGVWNRDAWQESEAKMIAGRDKACDCKRGQVSVIELGGENVIVSPIAKKTVGVIPYPYLLEWGGYDIRICADWEKQPELGDVRVRYGAIPLLEHGVDPAHQRLVDWLAKIGFTTTQEKLTRVDVNVLLLEPVTDFKSIIDAGCYVTQAKNRGEWGSMKDITTYQIGNRKSTFFRMYDKRSEMLNDVGSPKWKLTIDRLIGWDVWASGCPITRFEFSLGRTFMKKYGIYSLADFRAMEQDIVDVHTWQWIRFLASPKVRGHENTAPLHPHWEKVRAEFLRCFPGSTTSLQEAREAVKRAKANAAPDVYRLVLQYRGLQRKILARTKGRSASVEETKKRAAALARGCVNQEFHDEMNNLVDAYQIRNDCTLGQQDVECIEGFEDYQNPSAVS